jgi:putative glutamine amidotransferase
LPAKKKTISQPVIGIVPSFDEGNNIPAGGDVKRVYIRHEYMNRLAAVGAVPLILHPDMTLETITDLCDGVVISGGEDIEPHFYGAEPLPSTRFNEPKSRYIWEMELIEACDKAHIPILGVCYGLQRLNAHYGGTLIQDIPTTKPDTIGHDVTEHEVTLNGEFLGMNEKRLVASRHHQAVDRLAEGFTVKASAPDGIIEAIEGHGHFGMQWHPESDTTGLETYREFVNHCIRSL